MPGSAGLRSPEAITAEHLAETDAVFDIVIAIRGDRARHRPPGFLETMARFGRADGSSMAVLTTINRSLAGVAAVNMRRNICCGWPQGVPTTRNALSAPGGLRREAAGAGIMIDDVTGIRPSLMDGFSLGGPSSIMLPPG